MCVCVYMCVSVSRFLSEAHILIPCHDYLSLLTPIAIATKPRRRMRDRRTKHTLLKRFEINYTHAHTLTHTWAHTSTASSFNMSILKNTCFLSPAYNSHQSHVNDTFLLFSSILLVH